MKSESHMVIYSTTPHRNERFFNHLKSMFVSRSFPVSEQKEKFMRQGKFRRFTKTAKILVIGILETDKGFFDESPFQRLSRLNPCHPIK